MREFPHAAHERGSFWTLYESDFTAAPAFAFFLNVSADSKTALIEAAPHLPLLLSGGLFSTRLFALRGTPFSDRAHRATWFARHAQGGAELHHRLIGISRA